MDSCQNSANRIIEGAVVRMTWLHTVDKTARDADDYRQLFRIKVWQASQTTPDHGENAHERWLFTSVRNQLRTFQRELMRYPPLVYGDLTDEIGWDECREPNFERQMEIRHQLHRLRRCLTTEKWQLLMDYAIHGSATGVWEARGRPGSCGGFCKRIRDLRQRCQKIIKQMV